MPGSLRYDAAGPLFQTVSAAPPLRIPTLAPIPRDEMGLVDMLSGEPLVAMFTAGETVAQYRLDLGGEDITGVDVLRAGNPGWMLAVFQPHPDDSLDLVLINMVGGQVGPIEHLRIGVGSMPGDPIKPVGDGLFVVDIRNGTLAVSELAIEK